MKIEQLTHEFVVTKLGETRAVHRAKTREEAIQWIADSLRADLLGTVEYEIHEVYSNR